MQISDGGWVESVRMSHKRLTRGKSKPGRKPRKHHLDQVTDVVTMRISKTSKKKVLRHYFP